jgi:hypothetical protein
MKYRKQQVNFRTSEFPMAASAFNFLLSPRFNSFDTGELFDFVMSTLFSTTGVRTNRVDFTLVNVSSPFSNFSHGFYPTPHISTWPSGKALIFTFAIAEAPQYTNIVCQTISRMSNHCTRWTYGSGSSDFVSVSIDQSQAHEWGLLNLQPYQLFHLYNVVGAMTKNVIRRQSSYIENSSYEDMHSDLNLVDMHDRYFAMPLKRLFTSVPISLWGFNKYIWAQAPQLLMMRLITPQLALYYFMYIANSIVPRSATHGIPFRKRLGTVGTLGIVAHLSDSALNLVQLIKSPSDNEFSAKELLAPTVLTELISSGRPQISGFSRKYRQEFSESTNYLVQQFSDKPDVYGLLMPADKCAVLLLNADPGATSAFIANILRNMDLGSVEI